MSETKVIAFATQKGGAGKSTISTHIASTLCYLYGYKVALLDCDYPQHTIQAYRVHEQQKLQSDKAFQERLVQQGIAPYPVAMSNMEDSVSSIDALSEQGYDFILVDTPGTVNVNGLPELLQRVDYIFLPMEPDLGTISSSMSYMHILGEFLQAKNADSNLLGFYAFWNKYLKSEKKDVYAVTDELFRQRGYPLLNSRVDSLVAVKEKRSTLFSMPERELSRMGLGHLINEVITLILGQGAVTPSGATITFEPTHWPELAATSEASAVDSTK